MSRDQGDTPRTPPEESQRQQTPPGRPPQQPQKGGQGPGGAPQGRPPSQRSQGQQSPRSQPPSGGQSPPQGRRGPSSPGVQPGQQSPQSGSQPTGMQSQGGTQRGGMQQPPQGGPQSAQRQPTQQPSQSIQRGQPGGMQSQQPGLSAPPMHTTQMGQRGQQAQQMQSQLQTSQSGAGLLEPMTIDDVVTTDVYTVESDTEISEVVEQMDELNVGSAIVEEDDTPIGILTDRKIALALSDDPNVVERTADDLTSGEVVSAMTGTQVSEVLDKMSEENIRRIPVVDENGELEGIVTLDDVLMLLESKMSKATDTIQGQLPNV